MNYTIWSNGGRHEFLIREDGEIVRRSGMIYRSRAAAKRALIKALGAMNCGE